MPSNQGITAQSIISLLFPTLIEIKQIKPLLKCTEHILRRIKGIQHVNFAPIIISFNQSQHFLHVLTFLRPASRLSRKLVGIKTNLIPIEFFNPSNTINAQPSIHKSVVFYSLNDIYTYSNLNIDLGIRRLLVRQPPTIHCILFCRTLPHSFPISEALFGLSRKTHQQISTLTNTFFM